MAVFTAAAPPAQGALGDQWYDTGNGNRRAEASAVVSWGAPGWSGWTGSSASVQVEAQPSGPAVLMVICAGTGNWLASSPGQPVNPGDVVSAAASVSVPPAFDVPVNLNDVSLGIAWYDGTSTLLSVTSGTAGVVNVGASATLTVAGTAPVNAASFSVQPGDAEASPEGTLLSLSSVVASRWVPWQVGTDAISAGSITSSLIAAGTVVAGMVDGTVISGAKFVAYGSTGEILVYSGTPAAGNLIGSISATSGNDAYGNAYLPGLATYTSAGGTWYAVNIIGGFIEGFTSASYGGPWSSTAELDFANPSQGSLVVSGDSVAFFTPFKQPISALEPGTTSTAEPWHSLTPGNGWTGSFSYKLTPLNEVAISCNLTAPSSSVNGVTIVTLPSGYTPAVAPGPVPIAASAATGSGTPYFTISTGGVIQAQGVGASATNAGTNAKFPLGL